MKKKKFDGYDPNYYKDMMKDWRQRTSRDVPNKILIQARTIVAEHLNHYSVKNNIYLLLQAKDQGDEMYTGNVAGAMAWKSSGMRLPKGSSPYYVMGNRKGYGWTMFKVYDISQTEEYWEEMERNEREEVQEERREEVQEERIEEVQEERIEEVREILEGEKTVEISDPLYAEVY